MGPLIVIVVQITDVNTIGRRFFLFLPALHQVNVCSDLPRPAYLVQSGPNQGASKFMELHFPQTQRAETSSAPPHPVERSNHQGIFILVFILLSKSLFHGDMK